MNTPNAPSNARRRRIRLLGLLALTVVLLGTAFVTWDRLIGSHYEHTDNAYVQAPVVQITPQSAGTLVEFVVQDTDFVRAGQLLVRLDPSDARIAVEQAEAQLAQAVREVSVLYGNNETLAAQIRAREADVARAQSDVQRLQGDLSRRTELARSGAVSNEELTHYRAQLSSARSAGVAAEAAVAAAREQLITSRLLTENTSVASHPNVQQASARLREAMLALARTEIRAPVTGYVAQRHAQLGQRVQPGAPLMVVIPLDRVWVDANFKESQLADMRLGQAAELVADTYGKSVTYRGTVEGLGAGTGAAFALIPAQNASGNWIKVVQRVPVRIRLDAGQLSEYPLRVGLSMHVKVMVDDKSGRRLSDAPLPSSREVLDPSTSRIDADEARIQSIIARNLARASPESVTGAQAVGTADAGNFAFDRRPTP